MSKPKKTQSRVYGLILPCKWENHMKIIHHAKSLAKHYYWIRHDRDFYGDAPDDAESSHAPGELKDPHIHLLFKFNSSRDLKTVQNYFKDFEELKDNSFEVIHNAHGAERYLVHADNPEKAQYGIEEVETNDRLFKNVFIEKRSSADELALILDAYNDISDLRDFVSRFAPILENLTTYGKMIVLSNLRKDWFQRQSQISYNKRLEKKIHDIGGRCS